MGSLLPFAEMTPFDTGAGSMIHKTVIRGLDADPNVVNEVYLRCAAHPDFALLLRYRSLSEANPAYPRTGNLWGSWDLVKKGLPYSSRIDLWLGASFNPDEIRELRRLNPDVRILTSINAVENSGLPDEYYLKDIHGKRIEVWPGSYRLNLTKPYVAEYQARYAYQHILGSGLMVDGCFFDNVMTTQSWLTQDIYGNLVYIDADEDGNPDKLEELDAAWKAGVLQEMETFRKLMPHVIVSGHAMYIYEQGIANIFNGISLGFRTADVIEGEKSFAEVWEEYSAWHKLARQPTVTMIESSPPDQISYGYGYTPWDKIPPPTLEFARTYSPYVRFGLAFTLMNDGYFAHEFGDTWHGNDWWYDELDFDLGYPHGPARRVDLGIAPGENLIVNGDFEEPISPTWNFWADTQMGCDAQVSRDVTSAAQGSASARIDVYKTCGGDWHIELAQYNRSLVRGTTYEVSFWAKSDVPRFITLNTRKGSPDWRDYGLYRRMEITPEWKEYTVLFEANETTSESRLQFMVGETEGTVWIDNVQVRERGPNVFQREFTNGLVILNASRESQTIRVGPGYWRLKGSQAPLHEYLIDDGDGAFSIMGDWKKVTYDSGEWGAAEPFYHDWGEGWHESNGPSGEAHWDLSIPQEDTYTIAAWWPAEPSSGTWSQSVTYEVVAGGKVVASETFDQRSGGDEWHRIASVSLSPHDKAFVRMSCPGGTQCIADALYVRSAARYNDGSPAPEVTLRPMDGIVLMRSSPPQTFSLAVSKGGSGSGTVTSSPAGIHCSTDCMGDYTSGAVLKLTATPDNGSSFAGWRGACSGMASCTLTLDEVKTATAIFITPLTLGSAALEGEVDVAYRGSLGISGGLPPYTIQITKGALPAGLSPNSEGIAGTPARAGISSFTVQVTDDVGFLASRDIRMKVFPALSISTKSLKKGKRGKRYSAILRATGGKRAYAWLLISGDLPKGLTLESSTGRIIGTPTAAGSFTLTFQVTDALGGVVSRRLLLDIN